MFGHNGLLKFDVSISIFFFLVYSKAVNVSIISSLQKETKLKNILLWFKIPMIKEVIDLNDGTVDDSDWISLPFGKWNSFP